MRRVQAALCLSALFCGAARAEPQAAPEPGKACELPMLASLDFRTTPQGMISLPGAIDGHKGGILVDTGGTSAILGFAIAKQLANPIKPSGVGVAYLGGVDLHYGVRVDRFELGTFPFEKVWFMVAPDRMMDGDLIGEIQPHALSGVNFEIDFVKGKFNLFGPGTCPGRIVYWTHEPYARVPMDVDPSGHIVVEAMLDGKPVKAYIDTGAQGSQMSLKTATHIFGIDEKNPAVKRLNDADVNGMVKAAIYRYPFTSLTFEGIEIKTPSIAIMDAGRTDTRGPELVLGMGALRQLHLFIAYDEKMLYLTAAEAR